MDFKNKNVLLIGLAKTGISTIKKLSNMNANIIVNDIKPANELKDIINELKGYNVEYVLGKHIDNILNIDLTIVSPGVPLDLPFIESIKSSGIEIISEVELSYRLSNAKFIGITGTNGKTTTTTLVGEIFKQSGKDTHVVGNIGNPVIDTIGKTCEESVLVTELSSFQLESIATFKPSVSAILNITPDHLNRHKTMANYIAAKARVFENQDENDFTILNYDCEHTRKLVGKCRANVIFFSVKTKLNSGIFLDGENIIIKLKDKTIEFMNKNEIYIPGNHNLENALCAIGISVAMGVDLKVVEFVLKNFRGVEHRLEFVTDINGVMFVNDSKGTNPDASIKAIQSYEKPIILIAGGYDKKSDFSIIAREFGKKLKALILLGQTATQIKECAINAGFENNYLVKNMKEAVEKSFELSQDGDVVLLSPACASWGMYNNYEERGIDFKNEVLNLN